MRTTDSFAQHAAESHRPLDPLVLLDARAVRMPCKRGAEICRTGETARFWYRIASGMARQCALSADGKRQIVDFLAPGDFFGFSSADEQPFTVEAIVAGTWFLRYPRSQVEQLIDAHPRLSERFRKVAFASLSRMQARMLHLGRTTAQQKVGSFLVEMSGRSAQSPDHEVRLGMTRYDIADYLALSVETVSRTLTDMKRAGLIRYSEARAIQILDRDALEDLELGYS